MLSKLSHIQGTCHDFDGVFYDPAHIPDYYHQFETVFGTTLTKMFPHDIDHQGAMKIDRDGYARYGDSITGLMEWANTRKIGGPTLREDFFRAFHQNLYIDIVKSAPHVFSEDSDLIDAFQKIHGRVQHGIATHGCAESWTRPLLPLMKLHPFIKEAAIFGLSDSGFRKKSTDHDLVKMCLEALEVAPENAAYTEDTAINLQINKDIEPRLTTIFLNNGRPLDSKPSYIDLEFRNLKEYLTALHAAHSEPRNLILV